LLLGDNSFFLKTALATDYESHYVRLGERSGYGVARSTRIQEIENYGSREQRTLPEDQGLGLVWRLFTISRYAERDGGVYFELEAIGLSRDIPGSLKWLLEPIVRRVSRESISTSLRQTQNAVRFRADLARGGSVTAKSISLSSWAQMDDIKLTRANQSR
jgi:hypothetical protein